jgi:hypothetical protein
MCQLFVSYFLWNSWERIASPLTGQDLSDGLRLRPGFVVPLLRIEGLETLGFQMQVVAEGYESTMK